MHANIVSKIGVLLTFCLVSTSKLFSDHITKRSSLSRVTLPCLTSQYSSRRSRTTFSLPLSVKSRSQTLKALLLLFAYHPARYSPIYCTWKQVSSVCRAYCPAHSRSKQ